MTRHACEKYREDLARLADGTLDAAGRARLEAHAAEYPVCREEFDWIVFAGSEFEALGDRIVAGAPEIDVTENVMARVRDLAHDNVVEMPKREQRPEGGGVTRWLAIAAAVAMVAAGALYMYPRVSQPAPNVAQTPDDNVRPREEPRPGPVTPDEELRPVESPTEEPSFEPIPDPGTTPNTVDDTQPPPPPRRLERETVVAAFAESLVGDDEDLNRIVEMAKVPEDKAAQLLNNADNASPEALLGASQSLPKSPAVEALLIAVSREPDNAYGRYRLASALAGNPETSDEAKQHTDTLAELDPDNALAHYLEAERHLAANPPDLQSALQAFAAASQLETANGYSQASALSREQALIESGAAPADMARLLSALTAGRWEYEQLTDIATSLQSFGQEFEAVGQLETAAQIYEAMLNLGEQLERGSNFSQEQLAGLDMQQSAIEALQPIYDALGHTEQLGDLAALTNELLSGFSQLSQYFRQFNEIITALPGNLDQGFWMDLADNMLSEGDRQALEFLLGAER